MLTNDKEQDICEKYRGKKCFQCPLYVGNYDGNLMCKAVSHYDEIKHKWVMDAWTSRETSMEGSEME